MANIVKRTNGNGSDMTAKPGMSFGWVDDILNDTLTRFFHDDLWGFKGMTNQTAVPVNIRETEAGYEMEIVAPGLKKEDFKVNISKNMLTVSFEHNDERHEENKQGGYLHREFRMQSFSRSFNLDDTVNVDKINAQYENGVLRLTLPKNEGAQQLTRTIDVQ